MLLFCQSAHMNPETAVEDTHQYCVNGGSEESDACQANTLIFESAKGNDEKTKTLEVLSKGKVLEVKMLRSHGSAVYVLSLDYKGEKRKAIFKLSGADGKDNELAAVGISQLGGFGVVPLGLLRTISIGDEKYTGFIQEFIPGNELYEVEDPYNLVESDEHYKRYNLILLFDTLVKNHDRQRVHHGGSLNNWYLGNNGLLYAIDHQFCSFIDYEPDRPIDGASYVRDAQIPLDAAQAIIKASKNTSQLRELVSHFKSMRPGSEEYLVGQLKKIANSIEIRDGKAFIRKLTQTT